MKVYVIGSGAMGSLFAGHLAKSGVDVVIAERNPDIANQILNSGLRLTGVRGKLTVKIPVVMKTQADPSADLVIVCVKAYDTAAAVDQHLDLLKSAALVLSIQNGIGNIEEIAGRIGEESILAGTTTMGSFSVAPGIVNHVGDGETVIGEIRGGFSERAQRIANLIENSGLKASVSDNIEKLLWTKLCVNAAINPLTAVMRVRNGVLTEHESTRNMMIAIVDEVIAVAREIGVELDRKEMREWMFDVAQKTANNRSSMLSDLMGGKRTEIDFINGSVVKLGKQYGVAVPKNEALARLILAMEATRTQWITS